MEPRIQQALANITDENNLLKEQIAELKASENATKEEVCNYEPILKYCKNDKTCIFHMIAITMLQ